MTIWSCATCGIEHPHSAYPPSSCAICEDERQWVPASGQRWTSQAELESTGHRTRVEELEPDLYALITEPTIGIGQRSLLVRTPGGNLLWEPPGFVDSLALDLIRNLGGVDIVSASHPHLTGASIQFSHAFGRVPVLVASADREWIQRPDDVIELWVGVREVLPGITFLQCGGHFAGSSVAHWAAGSADRGALLTGDTIAVGADRKSANCMRSFVNNIPLPERAIRRILDTVEPWNYDRMYSAFGSIESEAKAITATSLERYIAWIRGDIADEPER